MPHVCTVDVTVQWQARPRQGGHTALTAALLELYGIAAHLAMQQSPALDAGSADGA